MNRTLSILGGAAAVQLCLVGITWWPRTATVHEAHTLVSLENVDHIEIMGRLQPGEPAPEPLILDKTTDGWALTSAMGYPADPEKVDAVLDKLASLEVRAPVATQASSHTSLNVSDSDHGRTVLLKSGDDAATLILGSASGTAAHVRRSDDDDVYTVRGWTAFSISDQAKQYWDSKLLDLDPATIDSLTITRPDGSGFTLKKTGDDWSPAGEELDLDENSINAHLGRLANVRMASVLGRDAGPSPEHATRVQWTAQVGDATTRGGILLGADDGQGNTVSSVEGNPWTVTTPTSSIKSWHTLSVDALIFVDALEDMPDDFGAPHGPGGAPHGPGGPPH